MTPKKSNKNVNFPSCWRGGVSKFSTPKIHGHTAFNWNTNSLELQWMWAYHILGYQKHGKYTQNSAFQFASKCAVTLQEQHRPQHICGTKKLSRDQKYSAGSRSGKFIVKISKRKKTKKERRKPTVTLLLFVFFRCQQNWSGS